MGQEKTIHKKNSGAPDLNNPLATLSEILMHVLISYSYGTSLPMCRPHNHTTQKNNKLHMLFLWFPMIFLWYTHDFMAFLACQKLLTSKNLVTDSHMFFLLLPQSHRVSSDARIIQRVPKGKHQACHITGPTNLGDVLVFFVFNIFMKGFIGSKNSQVAN